MRGWTERSVYAKATSTGIRKWIISRCAGKAMDKQADNQADGQNSRLDTQTHGHTDTHRHIDTQGHTDKHRQTQAHTQTPSDL